MNLKQGAWGEEEEFVSGGGGGIVQAEYVKFPLPGTWVGSACLFILQNISPLQPQRGLALSPVALTKEFVGTVTASRELPAEAFMAFS